MDQKTTHRLAIRWAGRGGNAFTNVFTPAPPEQKAHKTVTKETNGNPI